MWVLPSGNWRSGLVSPDSSDTRENEIEEWDSAIQPVSWVSTLPDPAFSVEYSLQGPFPHGWAMQYQVEVVLNENYCGKGFESCHRMSEDMARVS